MTTVDRFDRYLGDLLTELSEPAPPAYLDDAIAAASARPQRRALPFPWVGSGGPARRRSVVLVLAVAALALATAVSVLTIGGLPRDPLVVAPTVGPSTEASVAPTPAVTDPPVTDAPVTATPDPKCLEFEASTSYTATVGTLPVSLTVPATPDEPWFGVRDEFFLGKASCYPGAGASPYFEADLVAHVYADVCQWQDRTQEIPTAFDLVQALATDSGPAAAEGVETELGFFRATRFDIDVPADFDASACDDGELRLWADQRLIPGMATQVYVAEIDGSTFVMTLTWDPATMTPAGLEEIDAILASFRVEM